jgi:hypothetical protein
MVAYVIYRRPQWRAPLAPARDSGSLRAPAALASGPGGVKALRVALAGVALLGLAACGKLGLGGGDDQMSWARAAIERNNRLEVVASDPQTNTFTVRVKDTGELRMIRVDEVVGNPPGMSAPTGPAQSGTAAPAPATSQPAPESSDANTPTATASTNSAPGQSSANSEGGPAASAPGAPAMSRSSATSNAPRTGFQSEPAPAAEAPNPNSDVASITPGGRTLESGPGYAIKVASKAAPSDARTERERSATTSAAIERRHEPIICQGDRLLQIDNRNLEFDGDAVSAQDGCEIHITNSHITARGVGVSVRRANVHIDNSQIEGDSASIDASEGAQVYAASSRFKGMSRRLDNSSFHDLGGNVWN